MKVENTNLKSVLIDFLRFGIWQIQNDKCTYEQMRSIAETIMEDLKVMASRNYGNEEESGGDHIGDATTPAPFISASNKADAIFPRPSLWMRVLQSEIIYLSLPLSC